MRQNFYTLRGYDQMDKRALSAAMEDYLEMIYRHQSQQLAVRIGQLAERLHVQPPAASKIVKRLSDAGYVYPPDAQGVRLTPAGWEMGAYLLKRHEALNRFFCLLNESEQELELVEKIEHFMDRRTVENIAAILAQLDGGEQ